MSSELAHCARLLHVPPPQEMRRKAPEDDSKRDAKRQKKAAEEGEVRLQRPAGSENCAHLSRFRRFTFPQLTCTRLYAHSLRTTSPAMTTTLPRTCCKARDLKTQLSSFPDNETAPPRLLTPTLTPRHNRVPRRRPRIPHQLSIPPREVRDQRGFGPPGSGAGGAVTCSASSLPQILQLFAP